MHMRGDPLTMQQSPAYRDVVGEVRDWLAGRVAALQHAGIDRSRIVVDPGIGFGKTLDHNLALLARMPELAADGPPVLVGVSRKSMLGALTGRATGERMAASVGGALWCALHGADIIRVHDVRETRDALAVWRALDASHPSHPPGSISTP
jgi:dihydropteroate synthase